MVNEVFWVFTKNNKWEMFNYSDFDSVNSTTKLDTFYHETINQHKKLDVTYLKCYPTLGFKESLYSVQDDDFHVNRIEFDTLNRIIDLPMSYYVPYGHVHRKDQRYVIEVIPQKDSSTDKYWAFRGLKCVDETKSIRAHVQFNESIPDYSMTRNETFKDLDLLYSDGTSVPFGTLLRIDASGYLYKDDERITIALKQWNGKPFLYKSITSEINYDLITKIPYQGYLKFNDNTKKGLVSLLQTIKVSTNDYPNFVEDPRIENPLSSITGSWAEAYPRRGKYPGDNLDYNDPNNPERPEVKITTEVVPRTTPWGSTVTVVDCSNVAPVYAWNPVNMDSYIRPYDGGKRLYELNYLQRDPYEVSDENYYFSPTWDDYTKYRMSVYPGGSAVATDPEPIYNELRDSGEDLPKLLFWGPIQIYPEADTGRTHDHKWNVAYCVIDRGVEAEHSLPDAVVLGMGGAHWAPYHWARNYFRVGRRLKDSQPGVPDYYSNEGTLYFGTTDHNDAWGMTADNGLFDDMMFFKNEPKNMQGGSFDVANYTVVWMAVNVTRCMERAFGNVLFNSLSGLDSNGNVVHTPGLISRMNILKEKPCVPTVGFQNDYDNWASTALDSDERKCSVGIAHTAVFRVVKDEDFIFTQDFFINDSTLKATIIDGKELGTFTTSSVAIPYKLNPDELTNLFRFYNLMGDDLLSRDSTISSERYGTDGGGRSSYREHPAAYLATDDFETDQKIDDLRIKN